TPPSVDRVRVGVGLGFGFFDGDGDALGDALGVGTVPSWPSPSSSGRAARSARSPVVRSRTGAASTDAAGLAGPRWNVRTAALTRTAATTAPAVPAMMLRRRLGVSLGESSVT